MWIIIALFYTFIKQSSKLIKKRFQIKPNFIKN
ncbi:MAG: hypothetical protein HWN81_14745 [Candidatus Lokiarchaeota archaeon]|nr:hypothetical protein [Candidatus Lokiarchaeota archaeon]